MCRRNTSYCELLGIDPANWSKYEPLNPHPAMFTSLALLATAVRAAAEGDVEAARAALMAIDSRRIRDWYIDHAQVSGTRRAARLGRVGDILKAVEIDSLAYPRAATVSALFTRDFYRCRYCQRPVVHKNLLRALQAVVGTEVLRMGPTNLDLHGAVIAHRAVADHVLPRKRGGRTDETNLVTACYPCNFGKAHYTLDALGLLTPRPPTQDEWDGLQCFMPALKVQGRRVASLRA